MNNTLIQLLSYVFYPNPGNATYSSPKSLALMVFCLLLIVAAAVVSVWRRKLSNPVTKKLSRSWPLASFWFGFAGVILIIARVEQIQFVAMRLWWGVWILLAALYLWFQIRSFRMRHYEVLPKEVSHDPRDKYLPRKQKRR